MDNAQSSVLGAVPSDWEVAELQDLGSWGGGKTPRKSDQEYWNGETPWVSPKDMGGSVVRRTEDHVTQIALSEKNLTVYEPGSVIVVFRSGVLRHTFPVATCNSPFTVNQDMKVLSPGSELDNRFAFYLIDHLGPVVLQKATKVGTTVESVDTDSFMSLSVGVPRLDEQRRIADVLDTVDAAIQETDRVVEKQEQVKTGLLQDLLTRGLDANGQLRDPEREPETFQETEMGSLPLDWSVRPLDELAEIGSGVAINRSRTKTNPVELPYLRVANVQDGYLDLSEIKTVEIASSKVNRYLLKPGDVLMTEGGDYDKLGRGTVWRGQIQPCAHQNHIFRVRANQDELRPHYLSAVTGSDYGKQYFLRNSKQTTNLATINKTQLRNFPVPCPPVEEQDRILERLSAQEEQIEEQS